MTQTTLIGYGTRTVQLEIADGVLVSPIAGAAALPQQPSDAESDETIAARVAGALAHPEQFLKIAEMVVPGDTVAIALDDCLPRAEAIVTGILRALEGCDLAKVVIVAAPSIDERALSRLRESLPETVDVTIHDVANRGALGYLGADEDAEPIRVNRTLVDADLVLPVSVMRVTDPLLAGPSGDALYPGLVDHAQQKRLQRSTARAIARCEHYHNEWAAGQAHQVRWTLGVQLMVAVEVTCGGEVGRVIASSPETLREAVRAHYAECRGGGVPESAEVVVACVEGDQSQQSLENLMRAALVARSHAVPAGTVVLVTTLKDLGSGFALDAEGEVDSDFSDEGQEGDTEPSVALSQAGFARGVLKDLINEIDTSRRYLLLFGGNWEAAEAFGFGVVQDEAALVRLINQHSSCCVLRAAQTAADAGVLLSSHS